jgi:hypothetical protein
MTTVMEIDLYTREFLLYGGYDGEVMPFLLLALLALPVFGQEAAPAPAPPPAPAPVVAQAAPVTLSTVRTIYILPLTSGFDQYLANHLTQTGAYEVVVDPALADAVITGQLGESFEQKLKELYPPPAEAEKKQEEEGSDAADQKDYATFQRGSGFSRGRGNVFLVDPRARRVLWSTWLPPKSSMAKDLDKAAQSVVKRLTSDVKNPAN